MQVGFVVELIESLGAMESSLARRMAADGAWYTFSEFQAYYGDAASAMWQVVGPTNRLLLAPPTPPLHRGRERTVTASPQHRGRERTEKRVMCSHPPIQGQPEEEIIMRAQADMEQRLTFTLQDCATFQSLPGQGGGNGCQRQRALRALCLNEGRRTQDVTHETAWKAALAAKCRGSAQLVQQIVGPGVRCCLFRLLPGVLDHNYRRRERDVGERHVFELIRVDNTTIHLHFHANGTMDDPPMATHSVVVSGAPIPVPLVGSTGLECFRNAGSGTDELSYPISFEQADEALQRLLDAMPGCELVDITDGVAFDWVRFLRSHPKLSPLLSNALFGAAIFRGGITRDTKASLAVKAADGVGYVVSPLSVRRLLPYIEVTPQSAMCKFLWDDTRFTPGPNDSWLTL